MQTYASKPNTRRAAKQQFGQDAIEGTHYSIIEEQGKFRFQPIAPLAKESASETVGTTPPSASNGLVLHKSEIASPVKQVWSIADSMSGATRQAILNACAEQGVAFFTARTQYQKWKTARALPTSDDQQASGL